MRVLNVLLVVPLSILAVIDVHDPVVGIRIVPEIVASLAPIADPADTVGVDTTTPPILGPSFRYGVDSTISPCQDFYQYVNGDWRNKMTFTDTIRARQNVQMFADTYARTQQRLRILLDSARSVITTTKDPTLKVLGTFYESCLTTDSLERVPLRGTRSKTPLRDSTRAEQCLQRTLANLGGALGQAFAQELLATRAITRMQHLLEAIRAAVIVRLANNPWMTVTEKALAQERLQKLHLRVGMPRELVDYGPLVLSNNYYENKLAIANFGNQQWVNTIGGDVRERWKASLLTPNAFYSGGEHAIEVPAVMFMPPFFEAKGEDAVNFAGIGYVVGHEIFHSVAGQLPTLENTEIKTQIERLKAIHSGMGTVDGWSTDGKRTFNEDVADLGGVLVAYHAWKVTIKEGGSPPAPMLDGYTPDQRFFVALGRIWRAKWRGTGFDQDVHAAPFARVNGMVMHMPEFAQAFGCKDGDPMVLSVDKRAVIW